MLQSQQHGQTVSRTQRTARPEIPEPGSPGSCFPKINYSGDKFISIYREIENGPSPIPFPNDEVLSSASIWSSELSKFIEAHRAWEPYVRKYLSPGTSYSEHTYEITLRPSPWDDEPTVEVGADFILGPYCESLAEWSKLWKQAHKLAYDYLPLKQHLASHWWFHGIHEQHNQVKQPIESFKRTDDTLFVSRDNLSPMTWIHCALDHFDSTIDARRYPYYFLEELEIRLKKIECALWFTIPAAPVKMASQLNAVCRHYLTDTIQNDRRFHGTLIDKVNHDNLIDPRMPSKEQQFNFDDGERAHFHRARLRMALLDTLTSAFGRSGLRIGAVKETREFLERLGKIKPNHYIEDIWKQVLGPKPTTAFPSSTPEDLSCFDRAKYSISGTRGDSAKLNGDAIVFQSYLNFFKVSFESAKLLH